MQGNIKEQAVVHHVPPDISMTISLPHSLTIAEIYYRRDVKEFSRLWDTATTREHQTRMDALLQRIEAFESLHGDAINNVTPAE